MTLYDNIRHYRKMNHWSQDELAKRMGYSDRSAIAHIESGKVDLPQSKIAQFAEVFGVTRSELMGWQLPDDASPQACRLWAYYCRLPKGERSAVNKIMGIKDGELE